MVFFAAPEGGPATPASDQRPPAMSQDEAAVSSGLSSEHPVRATGSIPSKFERGVETIRLFDQTGEFANALVARLLRDVDPLCRQDLRGD